MSTGLFTPNRNPAASFANKQRARKPTGFGADRTSKSRAAYFRKRRAAKPKKLTKRDQFAELLSEDLSLATIAERMGITPKAAERHLYAIRKALGAQAV